MTVGYYLIIIITSSDIDKLVVYSTHARAFQLACIEWGDFYATECVVMDTSYKHSTFNKILKCLEY